MAPRKRSQRNTRASSAQSANSVSCALDKYWFALNDNASQQASWSEIRLPMLSLFVSPVNVSTQAQVVPSISPQTSLCVISDQKNTLIDIPVGEFAAVHAFSNFTAVVRCPKLALRYQRSDGKTCRIQVAFSAEADFNTILAILRSAGCPIQDSRVGSRDKPLTGYGSSSNPPASQHASNLFNSVANPFFQGQPQFSNGFGHTHFSAGGNQPANTHPVSNLAALEAQTFNFNRPGEHGVFNPAQPSHDHSHGHVHAMTSHSPERSMSSYAPPAIPPNIFQNAPQPSQTFLAHPGSIPIPPRTAPAVVASGPALMRPPYSAAPRPSLDTQQLQSLDQLIPRRDLPFDTCATTTERRPETRRSALEAPPLPAPRYAGSASSRPQQPGEDTGEPHSEQQRGTKRPLSSLQDTEANKRANHAQTPDRSRAELAAENLDLRRELDKLKAFAAKDEHERYAALDNMFAELIHDDNFAKLCEDMEDMWQRIGFE